MFIVILTGEWFDTMRPSLQGGPLGTSNYVFENMTFHWGSTDQKGSEHMIAGTQYPMEAHVLHYKQEYGSFEKAMKNTDGLVIVAYLYEMKVYKH